MQHVITNKSSFDDSAWVRITIWAAYTSGIAAAIGLVFLVIFFSGVPIFGPLNDLAVIVQYLLMLPITFAVYQLLQPYGQRLNNLALGVGVIGFIAVILLQSMLVLGVIPFRQQIVLVIPAFFVGTGWFILIERLGREEARLPKGFILHILAGLVFAYPIWAFKFAGKLKRSLVEVQDDSR